MTDTLTKNHEKLKTYIELMKSNSKASIPDNIESKLDEVKVEVINNGKEKFIKESRGYLAVTDNNYIKLNSTEKNKISKIIQGNYEAKFNNVIKILKKTRDDLEKLKELNINELDSLTTINTKTKGISESISTSEIDDIFINKLEKSKIFNEHKDIFLNAQRIPFPGERYSRFFKEESFKKIILELNDFYRYIEENKKILEKTSSPLQELIEKLVSKQNINVEDFYSDINVNSYLSQISIDDIKNELKDYKNRDIEFK